MLFLGFWMGFLWSNPLNASHARVVVPRNVSECISLSMKLRIVLCRASESELELGKSFEVSRLVWALLA